MLQGNLLHPFVTMLGFSNSWTKTHPFAHKSSLLIVIFVHTVHAKVHNSSNVGNCQRRLCHVGGDNYLESRTKLFLRENMFKNDWTTSVFWCVLNMLQYFTNLNRGSRLSKITGERKLSITWPRVTIQPNMLYKPQNEHDILRYAKPMETQKEKQSNKKKKKKTFSESPIGKN